MELHTCLLTQNDCYRRGRTIRPKGVMVHSTGANNPWLRRYVQPDDGLLGKNLYGNDWNQPGLSVCVHGFIGKLDRGDVAVYQTLPWEHRGWHCGASGNDTHISFEICEDDLTSRDYFEATYQKAAGLTAYLCSRYGLDPLAPGVVVDHAEGYGLGIASGHSDVGHWWKRYGRTMDDFRRDVARQMEEAPEMTKEEVAAIAAEAAQTALSQLVAEEKYKTLGDVTQKSYRRALDKLAAAGYLRGREGEGEAMVLDMSEDGVRTLVVLERALEEAGILQTP